MKYPDPPPVTDTGCHDPILLISFFDECTSRSLKPKEIADILRLPVDRIQYAMGAGKPLFERRAKDTAARRMTRFTA